MPSSEVRLYKGIPFDRDYSNVLYADMKTAYSAFRTITSRSYQRPTKNVSHPKGFARSDYTVYITDFSEDFYECDYIAFKNPNGKWFYGFIDDVVKANNSCGEITYTIDVFQTWFVPASNPFKPCLVSRAIVNSDVSDEDLYIDTVEPIKPTTYVHTSSMQFDSQDLSKWSADRGFFALLVLFTPGMVSFLADNSFYIINASPAQEGFYPVIVAIRNDLPRDIFEKLSENELYKSVCCAYYCFLPLSSFSEGGQRVANFKLGDIMSIYRMPSSIGGYTPRNRKLLYAPFRKIIVRDTSGSSMDLRPQDLSVYNVCDSLYIRASFFPGDQTLLFSTLDGHELSSTELPSVYYSMPIKTAFEIPLSIDQASLYWSQAQTKDVLSSTMSSFAFGLGMVALTLGTGGVGTLVAGGGLALSGAAGVMNATNNTVVSASKENAVLGTASSGISISANDLFQIQVYDIASSEEELRTFDDYFTKYGYAINKIIQPILTGRPTFNYVEIPDPIFNFTCPLSARQDLTAAFNRGVRLWHSASTFGDYSANNYNKG